MTTTDQQHVAIIGGGLAGALFALYLARDGARVDVYERRSDPRKDGVKKGGRSINLGLSKRGITSLGEVGLRDAVLSTAVAMEGRVIHDIDGTQRFQPYGKDRNEVLHSIDRNELNEILLDEAEKHPNVTLHFEHRCAGVDTSAREVLIEKPDGTVERIRADWFLGADGAFSKVREEMQRGIRANYSREFLDWGYKELTLPPRTDGTSQMKLNALHVWPRGHCLIVSHANRNGSHTLTLFYPFEGPDSFEHIHGRSDVEQLFRKYFPDLVRLLPELYDEWERHPTGTLVTTKTAPWHLGDWLVLVGDACHAVYPFYGQGMNSAFEDCAALHRALQQHADRGVAFREYERSRKPHTDTLAELSKANFVELRQKVASPLFLMKKRLDVFLNRIAPSTWMPLYTMIAHTTMPYGDALVRARKQDRVLWGLGAGLVAVIVAAAALAMI